ncbi:MAG: hypothetical protein OEM46_00615 [Ignavibacteria bacterium]|nr:hypothetical protein [Ignavibacteria bacterium]
MEKLKYLKQLFPECDLSALSEIGINEAYRLTKYLNEQLELSEMDFGLIVGYSLAYQRWSELSKEVSELKSKSRQTRKGDLDIHPLVIAEQKHSIIYRHWCKALSEEFKGDQFPTPFPLGRGLPNKDDDELDDFITQKQQTKDGD